MRGFAAAGESEQARENDRIGLPSHPISVFSVFSVLEKIADKILDLAPRDPG
jgi:hypothetical protein